MSNSNQQQNPKQPACSLPSQAPSQTGVPIKKSEDEWRSQLSPEQYRVLRQHGTEPPFRNEFWDNKKKGLYLCAGCAAPLFASGEKYDSRSGWPSFWDSIASKNVGQCIDTSHGMKRVEVHCSQCGGHLGHVFEDGPRPTGLRYCINSASIDFVAKSEIEARQLSDYSKHAK